ncbi:hypothetical protein PQ610_00735 [Tardisphaera miroshnichenkoae]
MKSTLAILVIVVAAFPVSLGETAPNFIFYATPVAVYQRGVLLYSTEPFELTVVAAGTNVPYTTVALPAGESRVSLPVGTFVLRAVSYGVVRTAQVVVLKDPKPIYVAIVWHDHQAPNFYPNGTFFANYAFSHVCSKELEPYYDEGVYAFKAQALINNPGINVSEEISPPLLLQWEIGTSKGWTYGGAYYPPNGSCAAEVRWTMETFLNLSKEGREEWLTSFYAHPISGYILSQYGWYNLMKEDLIMGENITDSFTGVRQQGMWLPEMAFTMKDVDLINESGIRFTALSYGEYQGARPAPGYSKPSPFEPYIVEDPSTGRTIVAFFRDSAISNYIAFQNNDATAQDAAESAEQVVKMIYNATNGTGGLVTIALDGENWILDSSFPSNSALFLNDLYSLLDQEEAQGVMETVTLQQALERVPPTQVLNYVPTGSWVDMSFAKWTTQAQSVQQPMWQELNETHSAFKAAEALGANASLIRRAEIGLFHASDSDYYWAEYVDPSAVSAWCKYVDGVLNPLLGQVNISASRYHGGVDVRVVNALDRPANLSLIIGGTFKPDNGTAPVYYQLPMAPRSSASLTFKGTVGNDAQIWLTASGYPFKEAAIVVPSYSSIYAEIAALVLLVAGMVLYSVRARRQKRRGESAEAETGKRGPAPASRKSASERTLTQASFAESCSRQLDRARACSTRSQVRAHTPRPLGR